MNAAVMTCVGVLACAPLVPRGGSVTVASGAPSAQSPGAAGSVEGQPSKASPPTPGAKAWLVAKEPDLRRLTLAIHTEPPSELRAFYTGLAKDYPRLEVVMKVHSDGGFGSGFLVVAAPARSGQAPRSYVVTNQHVVGLADGVEVRFQGQDETVPAQVVYVDELYDLAVLTLAESPRSPVAAGFDFSPDAPKDQDPVVATGYPGIEGEPSYQVTRGFVSNQRLLLSMEGRRIAHIQHTAPIDPGSSGGPLLDESGRILGMNTLKLQDREGVGLAVPGAVIRDALLRLHRAPFEPSPSLPEGLQACEDLFTHLNQEQPGAEVLQKLAVELVVAEGVESLGALPDDGTDWPMRFVRAPHEVFLHAIAHRLAATFTASDSPSPTCQPADPPTPAGRLSFNVTLDGKPRRLEFLREQGRYKLARVSLDPARRRSFLSPHKKRVKTPWKPKL